MSSSGQNSCGFHHGPQTSFLYPTYVSERPVGVIIAMLFFSPRNIHYHFIQFDFFHHGFWLPTAIIPQRTDIHPCRYQSANLLPKKALYLFTFFGYFFICNSYIFPLEDSCSSRSKVRLPFLFIWKCSLFQPKIEYFKPIAVLVLGVLFVNHLTTPPPSGLNS